MSSEEFEQSLKSEIENYLSARLNELRAEIERVQTQVGDAFAALTNKTENASVSDSLIGATIDEHLRSAHARGNETAAEAARVTAAETAARRKPDSAADLSRAIEELDDQRSQPEILRALIEHTAVFAPRVAFFVIKNEQAQGWRASGIDDAQNDNFRRTVLPLDAETPLGAAYHERMTWYGTADKDASGALFDALGGASAQSAAIPLVVRNKAVAVLYADTGANAATEDDAANDEAALNVHALETLVRAAAMAVELSAITRAAPRGAVSIAARANSRDKNDSLADADHAAAPESAQAGIEPADTTDGEGESTEIAAEQPGETSNTEVPSSATDETETAPDAEDVAPTDSDETAGEIVEASSEDSTDMADDDAHSVKPDVAPPADAAGEAGEASEENVSSAPPASEITAEQTEQNAFAADAAPEHDGYETMPDAEDAPEQMEVANETPVYESDISALPPTAFEMPPSPAVDQTPIPEPQFDPPTTDLQPPPGYVPPAASGENGDNQGSPLGAARAYGHEMELPVAVTDEDRRLHNNARRFARLLVSEIKLYNEQKVREARDAGDIYDRLREAIDRSRQMYDKRVEPSVASQFDYFHYELVSNLAEGDSAKLGSNYPGASV